VPAKLQISGERVDAIIDSALVLLTKENLFEAARGLQTTEAHWLYICLGQHLAGEYIAESGRRE
jgi:hypothetical protein